MILKLSAAIHVAALFVLWLMPHGWPGVIAVLIANHLVIVGTCLWPKSRWPGPNLRRFTGETERVFLSFDDGPDPEVTPQVLKLLADHQAHASFFCIGQHAARHPELVQLIQATGHRVENHSHRHPGYFALLPPHRLRTEIETAQTTLTALSGHSPCYFRAPMGFRNPFTPVVLNRLGLRFVSWTHRGFDTASRNPERVLRRLVKGLAPGDILLLHDGNGARDVLGRPLVLTVLPKLLAHLARHNLKAAPLPRLDISAKLA